MPETQFIAAGNAAAPGCNAGSSGVTNSRIFQAEQSPRTSAPRSGTLAGEGACVAEPKRLFLVQIEKQASINRATEPTDSAIRDPQSAIFSIIGFNHFTPPLAAEVLARDGRLVYVRTRLFAGHVTNFSGVWKGNSHWWDKPWKTQEWDIEIENGGVYRLCRANDEWFLTGEYD